MSNVKLDVAAPYLYDAVAFYLQELDSPSGDLDGARRMMARALAIADGIEAPDDPEPAAKYDNHAILTEFMESGLERDTVYEGMDDASARRRAASIRMSLKHFGLEDAVYVGSAGRTVYLERKAAH